MTLRKLNKNPSCLPKNIPSHIQRYFVLFIIFCFSLCFFCFFSGGYSLFFRAFSYWSHDVSMDIAKSCWKRNLSVRCVFPILAMCPASLTSQRLHGWLFPCMCSRCTWRKKYVIYAGQYANASRSVILCRRHRWSQEQLVGRFVKTSCLIKIAISALGGTKCSRVATSLKV